jgi:hypothetical protein
MGGEKKTHNWSLELGPLTTILIPTPKTRPILLFNVKVMVFGVMVKVRFWIKFFFAIKVSTFKT